MGKPGKHDGYMRKSADKDRKDSRMNRMLRERRVFEVKANRPFQVFGANWLNVKWLTSKPPPPHHFIAFAVYLDVPMHKDEFERLLTLAFVNLRMEEVK